MNALRLVLIPLTAGALAASLTACGGTGGGTPTTAPVGDGDPTPVATETAAPAVASGERPDPAADIVCDDLTNPAQLDPLFTVPVNLAPPTRTYEYVGASIADEWVVRQAGGVACQWSDPEGISTSEGRYLSGIDVRLLPTTEAEWTPFTEAVGDGSDRFLSCTDYGDCQYDRYYANGWWLSLSAFNIDGAPLGVASQTALVTPVFSSIATTVESLPAPDPTWTAPVPDVTFDAVCTDVTTGARIAAALGLSATIDYEDLAYPNVAQAAEDQTGGTACRWARASDGFDVVWVEVLPGGAWAQQAAKAAMEANGATVPTPAVPGVTGPTAYYEHVDSQSLDIVIGGTWVKVSAGNGYLTGGLSPQAALVAVAADIAAHAG